MPAFRCSNCNLNWPPNNAHVRCGRCNGKTSHMSGANPMTASETKHVLFEVYYENRELQRADQWLKTASATEFETAP